MLFFIISVFLGPTEIWSHQYILAQLNWARIEYVTKNMEGLKPDCRPINNYSP